MHTMHYRMEHMQRHVFFIDADPPTVSATQDHMKGSSMIYAVVSLTVTDKESLAAYGAQAGAALAKHGGKIASASAAPERIEGEATLPNRVVILEFPDKDAAHAWINDPELQEVHALRNASGTCNIVLLT
jgi:uncharacterized protein (DUF1330 family)